MSKRKAQKAARRHLTALADQLPHQRTSPIKLTLIGVFGFLLGATLGMIAGLAAATPPVRTPLSEGSDDLAEYLENLKIRAKEFSERAKRQGEDPEAGQPA